MFRVGYLAAHAIAFAIPSDPALADPDQWRAEWPDTDFSRTTIDFAEVISGGPPKDGIPALDGATFTPVAAETWLDDRETVMTYAHPGEASRACNRRSGITRALAKSAAHSDSSNAVCGSMVFPLARCRQITTGTLQDRIIADLTKQ